jgi:hypothetical protein
LLVEDINSIIVLSSGCDDVLRSCIDAMEELLYREFQCPILHELVINVENIPK